MEQEFLSTSRFWMGAKRYGQSFAWCPRGRWNYNWRIIQNNYTCVFCKRPLDVFRRTPPKELEVSKGRGIGYFRWSGYSRFHDSDSSQWDSVRAVRERLYQH